MSCLRPNQIKKKYQHLDDGEMTLYNAASQKNSWPYSLPFHQEITLLPGILTFLTSGMLSLYVPFAIYRAVCQYVCSGLGNIEPYKTRFAMRSFKGPRQILTNDNNILYIILQVYPSLPPSGNLHEWRAIYTLYLLQGGRGVLFFSPCKCPRHAALLHNRPFLPNTPKA